MSSGDSDRRSTTSIDVPSSAAAVAASMQVFTIGPYAATVMSAPSRATRAGVAATVAESRVSDSSRSAFSQ